MTRPTLGLALVLLLSSCHQHAQSARPARSSPTTPHAAGTATPANAPDEHFLDDDAWGDGSKSSDEGAELPDADVERAIQAVVDEAPSRANVPGVAAKPWDKKTPPQYLDRVIEHLGLTNRERALLYQNGFVASARHAYTSYGVALHTVHEQELPLYVSADAVLHGVFRSHEAIMVRGEMELSGKIGDVLEKMHGALVTAAPSYDADVAKDADLYLTVARRLLRAEPVPTALGPSSDVDALVAKADAAEGITTETVFGRKRLVDWTFFTPRGPYVREAMGPYFKAMVWLTRVELNLVSRGGRSSAPDIDRSETPREATLALALADLAKRAGVGADITAIDRTYRVLAGPREDVPIADLATLGASVKLDDPDKAAATLRAAIGDKYARTINYQIRPYDARPLPAIATFFGVGITPDAASITALSPRGDARVVHASEVSYELGHERALAFAGPGFPVAAAAKAKRELAVARRGPDLYASWLGAIRGFSEPIAPASPSFMKTTAFADARVASSVNAYAAIRHAYVLHAVQVYDEGGCTIPDAWVEPAIAVYDGILEYAKRLADAHDVLPDTEAYAKELTLIAGALRAISIDELAGRPISDKQRAFLRMVSEYVRVSGYVSRGKSRFNGWYPKLFENHGDAFDRVAYIGDFFTSTTWGRVSYAGAREPRLGIFIVDVAGTPRAMVGPIASAVELDVPIARRLDDDAWKTFRNIPVQPWERSYVGDDAASPGININKTEDVFHVDAGNGNGTGYRGELVVETVDEHAATLARATVRLRKTDTPIPLAMKPLPGRSGTARGIRVRLPNGVAWTAQKDLSPSF